MKFRILILLSLLIFLSCNSKEKSISEKEEKPTSRILYEELKEILPVLIEIQNQTFDDERTKRNYNEKHLYARFLTTENFVYLNLTFNDCGFTGFYPFQEKIDNHTLDFLIDSKSYKPQRYFHLNDLNKIPDSESKICEDWYFVKAKFKLIDDKLTVVKISTFFDNDYANDFYDKSDSLFLRKNKIMVEEPLPPEDFTD